MIPDTVMEYYSASSSFAGAASVSALGTEVSSATAAFPAAGSSSSSSSKNSSVEGAAGALMA